MDAQYYGWKCPQCDMMYSPTKQTCAACSVPKTNASGTARYIGTVTLSGTMMDGWATAVPSSGHTIRKSEHEQAQEAVGSWLEKGFSPKTLITAALEHLEDTEDEDDDEDDD